MAYKQMLSADDLCHLAAEILVNGQNISSIDRLAQALQIQAYLRRCINAGAIPARRWPLFGIEPAPLAPDEYPGLMVSIKDFREWVKRSEVEASETWADALSDSVQWNDEPIEGTQVVTGTPRGRGRLIPEDAQKEANEEAEKLRKLNGRRPTKQEVSLRLAKRFGVSDETAKDHFDIKKCPAYKK